MSIVAYLEVIKLLVVTEFLLISRNIIRIASKNNIHWQSKKKEKEYERGDRHPLVERW